MAAVPTVEWGPMVGADGVWLEEPVRPLREQPASHCRRRVKTDPRWRVPARSSFGRRRQALTRTRRARVQPLDPTDLPTCAHRNVRLQPRPDTRRKVPTLDQTPRGGLGTRKACLRPSAFIRDTLGEPTLVAEIRSVALVRVPHGNRQVQVADHGCRRRHLKQHTNSGPAPQVETRKQSRPQKQKQSRK